MSGARLICEISYHTKKQQRHPNNQISRIIALIGTVYPDLRSAMILMRSEKLSVMPYEITGESVLQ